MTKPSSIWWLGEVNLKDRVRNSVTQEELGVEPQSQLRWLEHLFEMPPALLPPQIFHSCLFCRAPWWRRGSWLEFIAGSLSPWPMPSSPKQSCALS